MIFCNFGNMKGGGGGGGEYEHYHNFNHNNKRGGGGKCHNGDIEVDSQTTPAPAPPPPPPPSDVKKQKLSSAEPTCGGGGDGSSIEVVRRPRGRPPGSKNKPKPPVFITRDDADSHDVMRPHVLEVPAGHDVADALARFSRRRNVGISVLAGTGLVSNVTLRQPSLSPSSTAAGGGGGSTFAFHGRFEILSISATFFPPSFSASSPLLPANGGFSVSLAGPHGQILGGAVAGPLVAAGTVTVVAAAFLNPTFHRLPGEEEISVSVSVSVSGDGETPRRNQNQQQMQHRRGGGGAASALPEEASGMPVSTSCHLLSDVIWAPMARAPHPPPY